MSDDRSDVHQQMNDALNRFKRAMQTYSAEHFKDSALSPAQLAVLKAIHYLQPISHKALAADLQLTPGAISQLIEALDQAGSIVRTVSESDRRVTYLSLSHEGKRLLAHYDKLRLKLITEATGSLSKSDLVSYVKVQSALTGWLESHSNK